jgi:hypothetical protein
MNYRRFVTFVPEVSVSTPLALPDSWGAAILAISMAARLQLHRRFLLSSFFGGEDRPLAPDASIDRLQCHPLKILFLCNLT